MAANQQRDKSWAPVGCSPMPMAFQTMHAYIATRQPSEPPRRADSAGQTGPGGAIMGTPAESPTLGNRNPPVVSRWLCFSQ